jgi:hypothetical protein
MCEGVMKMDFRSQQKSLLERIERTKLERTKRTAKLLNQFKDSDKAKPEARVAAGKKREENPERRLRKKLQSQLKKLQRKQEEQKKRTKELQSELAAIRDRESSLKRENWNLQRKPQVVEDDLLEKQKAIKAQLNEEWKKGNRQNRLLISCSLRKPGRKNMEIKW